MEAERRAGQTHTAVGGQEVVLFSKLVAQMEVGMWDGTDDTNEDHTRSTEHKIPELGNHQVRWQRAV